MRSFSILSALLLLSLVKAPVRGQEYRLENITSEYIRTEKGLSQNSANCIIQDQEGFLWIGTWRGLNRFDGYSFKSLTKDPSDPVRSLTNADIVGITEDTLGYIWAASATGLNRISKKDMSVTRFTTANSSSLGMVSDTLNTVFTDRNGLIWIGTNSGVMTLKPDSLVFGFLEHNPRDFGTISSNQVSSFCEDPNGFIWIGTRNGLNRYNPSNGQIIRYYTSNKPGNLTSSVITCMVPDRTGNIWIGTPAGLQLYDQQLRQFNYFPLGESGPDREILSRTSITSLFIDSGQELWIGTRESGLFTFDLDSKQLTNLESRVSESGFFTLSSLNCIIQDRNGLYWIGTNYQGLIKLVPDPHAFYVIVERQSVYGISEPFPNKLWIGTQKGILVWDRLTKSGGLLETDGSDPLRLTSNSITGLVDDELFIWILTQEGANRIRKSNLSNRTFKSGAGSNSIAGNVVWDVTKDSDDNYWFATTAGLTQWIPSTNQFVNYFHDPHNKNSLSNNTCYHVFEEKQGILLISTQYGLNEFKPRTGEWRVYLPVGNDLTSISSEEVFGVFRDLNGELWVYTNGGGFNSFDPSSGTFERYTTDEGLADNTVYDIHEDRDGIFWLPTNKGLSRFDPRDGRFTNFDVQDGLLRNEFNINSVYGADNGEIYLGGVNGVNAFLPQTTVKTSSQPVLRITDFAVHGEGLSYLLPLSDTVRLKFPDNTFTISFSALDYLNPFKNQFSYHLENFDKEITRLSPGLHQVDYRNVTPGHYVFHLRGMNSLGIPGEEISVVINVIPAWYQTTAFRILVVFMILLIAGTFIFLRLYNLRKRHEMEKQLLTIQNELVRSQKFALRSQMNPHFIFNSLNSIQNFVLKNDVDSANYYLSNFSSLMRKVLDYSQYNYITLAEELELIHLYLKMEHMRFSKKFDIEIRVDPSIDQYLVKIPPMFLQPYLENSVLHGLQLIKHKGLLQVLVEDHIEFMQINIIDNGIGRERARAIRAKIGHKSKGLENIEKRIQLYNKISDKQLSVKIIDLFDQQGQAAGTRVEIIVPYDIEDQSKEII